MRSPNKRKSAKTARRRIRNMIEDDDETYFRNISQMRRKRKKMNEWLAGDYVLVPDADCSSFCMRDWSKKEECTHGRRPSTLCDEECQSLFARYRLCAHVVVLCNFCGMPNNCDLCTCSLEATGESMDASSISDEPMQTDGTASTAADEQDIRWVLPSMYFWSSAVSITVDVDNNEAHDINGEVDFCCFLHFRQNSDSFCPALCDTICDREHFLGLHCKHGLTMCTECGNLWDGNAQCMHGA